MMKERLAAIVIGSIMLFSVAGFALNGLSGFVNPGNQPVEVPTVIENHLTSEQVLSILRSGRVLIRNVYTSECSVCPTNNVDLEIFANRFSGFVVLEKALVEPDNFTVPDQDGYVKLEMVSPTGEILDLRDAEKDVEGLTDMFCDISAVQPRECLLRDVITGLPQGQDEIMNGTSEMNATDATGARVDGTDDIANGTDGLMNGSDEN
jgi:hypothetical protein